LSIKYIATFLTEGIIMPVDSQKFTGSSPMNALASHAEQLVQQFNEYLEQTLNDAQTPATLLEAMSYSALADGKRVRPLLVYAAGNLFDTPPQAMHHAAAAVELIHCYSLIHDDLPAMDDDDLRRGRPTLHIAYDEAMAILAGDALQSSAFELLSDESNWPSAQHGLRATHLLAKAAGSAGMVGGQVLDIQAEGKKPSCDEIERMFLLKTGALIRVSAELGLCCCSAANDSDREAITAFGNAIGQAFQIQDDILDVVASSEDLGKPQGSDEARDKPNYALTFGMEFAQQRAKGLFEEAMSHLEPYGNKADALRWIANYIINRKK
jgi:geranylgeranyl pyrophosphate synthase